LRKLVRWSWKAVFLLSIVAVFSPAIVSGVFGRSVGVKAGDWVKYEVKCGGQSGQAWLPTYRDAEWVKREVQKVTDSKMTILETFHFPDGSEFRKGPYDWDVNDVDSLMGDIIPANLSVGDEISIWSLGKLRIDATTSRNYGQAERDTNHATWSTTMPYFIYEMHCYDEFLWDKKTGFLLEWTFETYLVGYENTTRSVLSFGIVETNLWEMKRSDRSNLQQFGLAFAGLFVAATVTVVAYRKSSKSQNAAKEGNSK